MKPLSIACGLMALLVLFNAESIQASRILRGNVEKGKMMSLKRKGTVVIFQSLPKGPVPPSGPSGCTYIPGNDGPPCPINARNFAGGVMVRSSVLHDTIPAKIESTLEDTLMGT